MFSRMRYFVFRSVFGYLKDNRLFVIFSSLMIFGFLIGCALVGQGTTSFSSQISDWFFKYRSVRQSTTFLTVIWQSFAASAVYLAADYLFGLCFYGCAGAAVLPFLKGLGLGSVCGFLYRTYSASGVAFSALTVVPVGLISSLILVLASRESFLYSVGSASVYLGRPAGANYSINFKRYHLHYLFYFLMQLIAAGADGVVSLVFGRGFSF